MDEIADPCRARSRTPPPVKFRRILAGHELGDAPVGDPRPRIRACLFPGSAKSFYTRTTNEPSPQRAFRQFTAVAPTWSGENVALDLGRTLDIIEQLVDAAQQQIHAGRFHEEAGPPAESKCSRNFTSGH